MTKPSLGLAILRVLVGVIYVMHGWPKFAGGVENTAGFLGTLGFPAPLAFAWLVTLLETVGGALLVVGFLVTPLALLFIVEMLLGILLVHAPNGFYVIGPGQDGVEFNLLLIGALLVLILTGPGTWSIDARRRRPAPIE